MGGEKGKKKNEAFLPRSRKKTDLYRPKEHRFSHQWKRGETYFAWVKNNEKVFNHSLADAGKPLPVAQVGKRGERKERDFHRTAKGSLSQIGGKRRINIQYPSAGEEKRKRRGEREACVLLKKQP